MDSATVNKKCPHWFALGKASSASGVLVGVGASLGVSASNDAPGRSIEFVAAPESGGGRVASAALNAAPLRGSPFVGGAHWIPGSGSRVGLVSRHITRMPDLAGFFPAGVQISCRPYLGRRPDVFVGRGLRGSGRRARQIAHQRGCGSLIPEGGFFKGSRRAMIAAARPTSLRIFSASCVSFVPMSLRQFSRQVSVAAFHAQASISGQLGWFKRALFLNRRLLLMSAISPAMPISSRNETIAASLKVCHKPC